MRYFVAAFLCIHGVAHLVGFTVPWKLTSSPELPYKTTILAGRLDVGDVGIRVVGLLWLALAAAMFAAAILVVRQISWALSAAMVVVVASLLMCAVEWPQARIGLFVNVALLLIVPAVGASAWRGASADARRELDARVLRATGPSRVFNAASIEQAPPLVARYFRRVLREGQSYIRAADITQDAEFLVGGSWRPLRATERFTTTPPGFIWNARMRMAPGVGVDVRDAYIGGFASMRGTILGLYPVVDQSGARELDAGALHRFFAEAVWFPTALLPGPNVTWRQVSERAAIATFSDAHTTVSLEFRFNDDGDVDEVFAPDRFAENHGTYQPKPWLVRCREYAEHDGIRIPMQCEVGWLEAEGLKPYWRGRVVDVRYEFGS